MTSHRYLLVGYMFPPSPAPEALVTAKALGRTPGWTADVITAAPLLARGVDESLSGHVEDRFGDVHRLRAPELLERLPLGRMGTLANAPDGFRLLQRAMRRACGKVLTDHRALISRSQPHSVHLAACRVAGRHSLPWISCLSDPWSRNPYVRHGRVTSVVNRRLEAAVLAASDRVVVPSPEVADLLGDGGLASSKVRVIPHAFEPEFYPATKPAEDSLVVRYLGSFYGNRSPEPFLRMLGEVIATTPALPRVRFEAIGRSSPRLLATLAATSFPNGTVSAERPVDHRSAHRLMAQADLLVNIDAPAEMSPFLPSKLVDYVGSGRPVFTLSPPGPATRLVADLGGWAPDIRDHRACVGDLREALQLAADGADTWGSPVVRRRYRSDVIGEQYAALLNEVSHD